MSPELIFYNFVPEGCRKYHYIYKIAELGQEQRRLNKKMCFTKISAKKIIYGTSKEDSFPS